jgi:hypothetical protein
MIGLRAVATMCDVCGLIVAKLADEYWPVSFPQTDTAVDELTPGCGEGAVATCSLLEEL